MKNHKYDWESNHKIAAVMPDFRLGKEYAFEVVFKELYKEMFYFCHSMIDNDQEVEDICLMVFQGLFNRCSEFRNEEGIMSFLTASTRNRCASYVVSKERRRRRHDTYTERIDTSTLDEHQEGILREAVYCAIEGLPDECKKIFKMIMFDGIKPREIARILKISVSTVDNQKFRAMTRLKKIFSKKK
jgi:RNA polymerase sigma-70 factor (ECF subfamily)